jgi:hypothetical protein
MKDTSSYQNRSKTLEEVVSKKSYAAISAYASYLLTMGHTLSIVSEHIPRKALPSLVTLIENVNEFGECKNFLTNDNDQETLQKCIDEYHFKEDLLGGIRDYTVWRLKSKEQIKKFTNGIIGLTEGGKQVIEDLHNRYQQYKTTPISQEDIEPGVFGIMPETIAIKSLIYRYLENPESYGKQLSKYLEKLPEARVEEKKDVKTYDKLWKAIHSYASYLYSKGAALDVVLRHIPEALPSLVTLIGNLEEWNRYRNPSTIDQEALEEYEDKYHFMAYFLTIILDRWPPEQKHTKKEIKRFTKGMKFLAENGKEIIDGLYKLHREVYELALKDLSLKDISEGYQTIPPYRKGEARVYADTAIWKILMNYFSNPKKYEDQLMKYAGMKPLDWLDRAICNLYGGCKTEKQST